MGVLAFAALSLGVVEARATTTHDGAQSLGICDGIAWVPLAVSVGAWFVGVSATAGGEGAGSDFTDSVAYTAAFGAVFQAVCSPFLHLISGRPLAALGALSARIGGPLLGVAATYGAWKQFGGWSTPGVLTTLSAVPIGYGSAIVLDYLYFTPVVAPVRGGATGGLAVTF